MSIEQPRFIPDYLSHWAQKTPDAPAMVHAGITTSYGELEQQVDTAARALLAAGIQRGDRVAVLAHPCPLFWLTFLASLRVGAVWLGLNPKYRLPELQYNVGDSRPSLLLGMRGYAEQDFLPTLNALSVLAGDRPPVIDGDLGDAKQPVQSWEAFLASGKDVSAEQLLAARKGTEPQSPALIVYTSGSTGRPKGAVLGHGGLVRSFEIQARRAPMDKLRVVANLPINHIGGVGDLCCTPLITGGTIVLQEQFDPQEMLGAVARHSVNAFMQVPTTLKILTEQSNFSFTNLSALRYVSWGGGPLPLEIIRKFRALGVALGTTYGMTEITGSVSYTDRDASDEVLAETVGRPIAEVELRIVDETGHEVATGERGELLVRHPGLLLEYFGNPEATAESYTTEGFFATGDVGYLRPDGNLCLVARTKEIFKSGGYNVYPREIELALEEFPSITLAAVVPAPHALFGEIGVAYVETSNPDVAEEELVAWCKSRLANYKVPKRIVRVDKLPLLPVGKVDKVKLRSIAAQEPIE